VLFTRNMKSIALRICSHTWRWHVRVEAKLSPMQFEDILFRRGGGGEPGANSLQTRKIIHGNHSTTCALFMLYIEPFSVLAQPGLFVKPKLVCVVTKCHLCSTVQLWFTFRQKLQSTYLTRLLSHASLPFPRSIMFLYFTLSFLYGV
jgi:hypothetical protein